MKPELIAYVAKPGTNNQSIFTRIGAAWPNPNAGGFKVKLDALPLGGEIILLPPKEDNTSGTNGG